MIVVASCSSDDWKEDITRVSALALRALLRRINIALRTATSFKDREIDGMQMCYRYADSFVSRITVGFDGEQQSSSNPLNCRNRTE